MFDSYDVILDGISGARMGVYPVRRPSFPAPVEKCNEYEVLGIDGKLYENTGFYEDIELMVEFNYIASEDAWHDTFRKCKKWILNAKQINLSDDKNYYHKIKKVVVGTNERESIRIGRFEVTFTLDPYYYLKSGMKKYTPEQCVFNQYDACMPVYFIEGEGNCILTVNGKEFRANVGQNLIIDSTRKISYRVNGDLENTSVSGNYADLYLKRKNTFSITSGFTLKIQPNWRVI